MANRIKLATLGPSVWIRELIRWRRGLPHLDGIDEDTQAARRLWPGDRLAGPSARFSFNLRICIRTSAERGASNSARKTLRWPRDRDPVSYTHLAKFAELWRRRMVERPRDDAQLKPRLTAAGKRKPRRAGFSDFCRVYQRQIRRGPQGVGRNQQRRPQPCLLYTSRCV